MSAGGKGVIKTIRPYLSRLKRQLVFRVFNTLRYWLDGIRVRFDRRVRCIRIALISDLDAPSSEQQFHPFATYRRELRQSLGVITLQLALNDVLRAPKSVLSRFDLILVKLSYRTTSAEAVSIIKALRTAMGAKCCIYFDGDDDLCVQWPEILPLVDLYVKKHAFRDRNDYIRRYIGKSNLTDYVVREFGHVITKRDYGNPWNKDTMITQSGPLPAAELDKIFLGVDLATDSVIYSLHRKLAENRATKTRDIDLLFRGSVTPETIVYHLRRGVEPILRQMEGRYRIVIPDKRVSRDEYYEEMLRSRICVSPFGYGEVCWRDYESVLCQSLLIKPDMSHVESVPNIFQAYVTYVPVKWDYSDLREKCEYYLNNEEERLRIVRNAYECLDNFYRKKEFVENVEQILRRCGLKERLA